MSPIIVRDLEVDFSELPRRWMGNSTTATAIANGINLLFPYGERFVVRAVNQFSDQITDPVLAQAIRGFCGQEGRHARVHDQFNQALRAQGFEIDEFLAGFKRIITWLERRAPARLNLAIAAAAEHFTAILAEGAFTQNVLDNAAPEMRRMLAWHAAEEIEHKAVSFDTLQAIDPSYALRIAGLVIATVVVGGMWFRAARMLLRQERSGREERARQRMRDGLPPRPRRPRPAQPREGDGVVLPVFVRGIRQYLRRAFHPDDNASARLAAQWMAARGISLPGFQPA